MQFKNVTIYATSGMFGVSRIAAKEAQVTVEPYAQYARALRVVFKAPRKRNARGFMVAYDPFLVIVEGLNGPEPETFVEKPAGVTGLIIKESKYSSCDPRYQTEALELIEKTGCKVLFKAVGEVPVLPEEQPAAKGAVA